MEPENTIAENSKKKFFIIALGILAVAGVALGYLFMQKDTPGQVTKVTSPTIVKKNEVPRVLSKEEKALIEERMKVSNTSTLSIKERTAISQKVQVAENFSTLTNQEKAMLEARIITQ